MTSPLKNLCLCILFALLSNCTSTINVHNVDVSTPVGLKKIKGNYAAYIQTGGWVLKSKAKGFACSAWKHKIDLNSSYKKSMKSLLENSLENITFYDRVLTKQELNDKGYNAQISILQGNAASGFSVNPGFFTSNIETTMDLNAIVSSFGKSGLQFQKEFKVSGKGCNDSMGCSGEKGAQAAAVEAIRQLVEIGSLYIRDGLHSVT